MKKVSTFKKMNCSACDSKYKGIEGLMRANKIFLIIVVLTFIQCSSGADRKFDTNAIPQLQGRVNVYYALLSEQEISEFEIILKSIEDKTRAQVVLLIVPTTYPHSIDAYSFKVANAWRLGRNGVDDGLLITFAIEDRKMRIEVGYGLEKIISDSIAKDIIEREFIPDFKKRQYSNGIRKGLNRIKKILFEKII